MTTERTPIVTAPRDSDQLRAVQRATRYALAELDRVCEELGLRYVVYGGTAIGAVRHGGFIPWDDDVDVCMPRSDYERFLSEGPTILHDGFVLIASETDPAYPKSFGILGLAGSEFTPRVAKNRPYTMPIGVDLFPLDPIPEDDALYVKQARRTWLWGRMLFLHGTATPDVSLPVPLNVAASAIMHGVHTALHLLRVKPRFLVEKWEAAARMYEGSSSRLLGDYSTRDPKRWSASIDELFPARRVAFDDITVLLPADYDAVLTRGYGDYMRLPPEDERVNHDPARVVLGPNYPG